MSAGDVDASETEVEQLLAGFIVLDKPALLRLRQDAQAVLRYLHVAHERASARHDLIAAAQYSLTGEDPRHLIEHARRHTLEAIRQEAP